MTEQTYMFDAEHLQTLYDITRSLNSTLDLEEVLEYVMDRVIQVTRAERGFLVLIAPDTQSLMFPVARGMGNIDLTDPQFQVSNTVLGEVIASLEPTLTINAQNDVRFAQGQSVITQGLRSILCVPILVRDELIGVVYVDNRLQSGTFNENHRDLVAAFASQAGQTIENARLYQLAVEKGRLERELQMARKIQSDLLPIEVETLADYEIAFDWRSAREVAGDFYDCFISSDQRMSVVVGDVADKGIPAAIYMAVARSLLRGSAFATTTPEETLRLTNYLLMKDSKRGMFVTMYYAVFGGEGQMVGVNAGHNCPIYYHADTGSIEVLPRGGRPLGWFEELPIEPIHRQMEAGDVVIFYTDGLTEAVNMENQQFGEERLLEVIATVGHERALEIKNAILTAVTDFVGEAPPFDDLTLVVVKYEG